MKPVLCVGLWACVRAQVHEIMPPLEINGAYQYKTVFMIDTEAMDVDLRSFLKKAYCC